MKSLSILTPTTCLFALASANSPILAQGSGPSDFEITLSAPSRAVPPAPGGSATAAIGDLLGSDVVMDNLLDVDTTTGNGAVIGPLGVDVIAGLAWDPNGQVLYATSTLTDNLYTIDPLTGASTLIGNFGISLMHGLGYDSNNDVLYGISNQSSTRALYRLDVGTAAATLVGVHGKNGLGGLAFDPGLDVMYASEFFELTLYRIDLSSGAATLVGPFGAGVGTGVGLAFDATEGLFASDNKFSGVSDDELFRIDTSSGAATLVGPINHGNVLGLTFQGEVSSCGTVYCDTNPDNVADIGIDTCSCTAGSINIAMSGGPVGQFGYLLIGSNTGVVTDPPGAQGDLCLLGSQIGRYNKDAGTTDGSGSISTDVLNAISGGGGGNIPSPPGGNICAPPGQTWNFQYWHRDGMNPSKFSKALEVTFL